MHKFFSFLAVLFFFITGAKAQDTVTIRAGAVLDQRTYSGPIYRDNSNSNMDFSRYAYLYTAAEINNIPAGSYISSIAWNKLCYSATTLSGGGKLRIYLKNSTVTAYDQTNQKFSDLISGATLVYSNDNTIIPNTIGFLPFQLSTPFLYTGNNLEVMVDWDISAVAGIPTTGPFYWERTTTLKKIYGLATAAPTSNDYLKPAGDSTGADITNTRPVVRFTLSGILPECQAPPTGGTIVGPDSLCKGVNTFLKVTGASTGATALHYKWQSSLNDINWTNIGSMSDDSIMVSLYETTFYRRITYCGSDSMISEEKYIEPKSYYDPGCGCVPFPKNCIGNYYISRVQLGTLDKSSACSPLSYVNYTDSTTAPDFLLTTSKTMTVTLVASNTNTRYVQVLIDLNHDGIFNDASNLLQSTANVVSGTITIPATATPGLTRMRVRFTMDNPFSIGACGGTAFTSGETEDYLINLIDPYACTTAPVNDVTLVNATAVCVADSVALRTSGLNAAATYTYQWQFSKDSVNWQDIVGARLATCVTYQDSARFYRTRIGCADQYVYTTPVKVDMKPWIKCYCKTYRTFCTNDYDVIKRVQFGSLDKSSTCSRTGFGYTDYADSVAVPAIQSGTAVPITVTVGNTGPSNYADVWIDFDMNGQFDSTEYTHIGNASFTNYALTKDINIPAGIGGLTKMRVRERAQYGETHSWDACNFLGDLSGGETEDYLVYIIGPKHCLLPVSNCTNGDLIRRVTMGTIDTATTCSPNGYGDFTKSLQVDTFAANSYVPLSVQVGCIGNQTENVGVWIDFNQNGVYERSEFTLVGRDCGATITNNISIPTNALAGLTNMRIRSTADDRINPSDACANYVNGETEEYNVVVLPYTECPTNTWTGQGGDSNWNNAANWSCLAVPGIHSNVVINFGSVEIGANVTVYSLNVNPSATVTVVPPFNLVVTH